VKALGVVAGMLACLAIEGCRRSPGSEGRRSRERSVRTPIAKPIIGVKIYEHLGPYEPLLARFAANGINTLFAGEELAREPRFRACARAQGMPLFVIAPVFYAPDELEKDASVAAVTSAGTPARDDWVAFICPSRPELRARRVQRIAELVDDLKPDGVSIDFVRYFLFWEKVFPDRTLASLLDTCYCEHCLRRFASESGEPLPADLLTQPQRAAQWIARHAASEWVAWKCEIITSTAREIIDHVRAINAGVQINIHAVPWRARDFGGAVRSILGQDHEALGRMTDFLSPMCYTAMVHRDTSWITSVVQELGETANCAILPSIQVHEDYPSDTTISLTEFQANIRAALEPPSVGVILYSWDLLAAHPEKLAAVANSYPTPLSP
jgi:hypothetical protein